MERLSRLRVMDVDRTRQPARRRIRARGVPDALEEHAILDTTPVQRFGEPPSTTLRGIRSA